MHPAAASTTFHHAESAPRPAGSPPTASMHTCGCLCLCQLRPSDVIPTLALGLPACATLLCIIFPLHLLLFLLPTLLFTLLLSRARLLCTGMVEGSIIGTLAWNTTKHMEAWYGIMG